MITINRIDRLLQAAKQFNRRMFPTVATITQTGGGFVLTFDLWDGVFASGGERITETFDTKEAARAAYDEFLKRYPTRKDAEPVLIDMTGR